MGRGYAQQVICRRCSDLRLGPLRFRSPYRLFFPDQYISPKTKESIINMHIISMIDL